MIHLHISMEPRTLEKFKTLYTKDSVTGCWNWTGKVGLKGYGILPRPFKGAHRWIYEQIHGEINNPKLYVCHKCNNKLCVNPDHLYLGTAKDNARDYQILRMKFPPMTHCRRGHKYKRTTAGRRICNICRNASARKRGKRISAGLHKPRPTRVNNRCNECGQFKSWKDLHSMAGDSDDLGNYESWFECINCMSNSDKERLGLTLYSPSPL